MSENIVIFCAHSDDEVLSMGGSIAKFAKDGKNIIVVIFSSGEMSNPILKEEVIIKERIKETKKVGRFLGVKETILLGIPDRNLGKEIKNRKLKENLENMIKKYKPKVVFTHSSNDFHKDHRAVFKIINEVMKKFSEISLYSFNVWNPMNFTKRNRPKLYVDISDYFEKKVNALYLFESQKLSVYSLLPGIIFKNFMEGKKINGKFAEKFDKIR